jgi:hypothetical protein
MTRKAYMRSALAVASLELFPPSVRQSLVSDRAFCAEYGLIVDAKVSLGKGAISLDRKEFFSTVRSVLTNAQSTATIQDGAGAQWSVAATDGPDLPVISLSRPGKSYSITNLFVLSPDASARLAALEKWAARMRLPEAATERWRSILKERPLENDEVNEFGFDVNLTVVGAQQHIRSEIESGSSEIETLVPRKAAYYDRLVGEYDGSENIEAYAANAGKKHLAEIIADHSGEGLMAALLLSSHSLLVSAIPSVGLECDTLDRALDNLADEGDHWSRLGVLELGLRLLQNEPQIELHLTRVASKLLEDKDESGANRYKILSALFVLVDGELSRTKILANRPPFWRRLAALAQASLIERQLIAAEVECEPFVKWAFQARGQNFYIQSLYDLREEPRWLPAFNSPEQLRAEFVGRVVNAAHAHRDHIGDGDLFHLLLGDGDSSFSSQIKFPFAHFAGPLEGGTTSKTDLLAELKEDILEKLGAEHTSVSSFITLINCATIFKIDASYAELAAKALREANYRLRTGDQEPNWFALISGLAHVAAVTRNTVLADGVWRLGRRWRQMTKNEPTPRWSEELFRIAMVAAASHSSIESWCRVVGEWLSELAFLEENREGAARLLSHIGVLLDIVPQLWITCGKAEAALRGFLGR